MSVRPSTRVKVALAPEDRADRAVAAVLQGLMAVFEANLEDAMAGSDPEALHDLRVSVRRSRSVQKQFKRVFPPEELKAFRKDFRWLQRVTGRTRDLDVQVAELAAMASLVPEARQSDLERLRDVLESRRQAARAEMSRALRSEKAVGLIADWRRFLEVLSESPGKDRRDGKKPIARLASRRIRRAYRRMVKRGRRIGPGSPSERYHELRKQGKELRYLLELFGAPLYPEEATKPMIKGLKSLQDVLGRHQDCETQIATLNGLGAEAARDGHAFVDPGLIQDLVEQLVGDKLSARRAFGPCFDDFARRDQRRLVKRVFG